MPDRPVTCALPVARRRRALPAALCLFAGLLVLAPAAIADTMADTLKADDAAMPRPVRRHDRNAIEYVLALPSIALKIPVRTTATVVSAPVIIVERNTLLPAIQRWLAFVDFGGLQPIVGYGATPGLEGGLAYHHRNLLAEGVGLGVRGSYSTNLYRSAAFRLGGARWRNSRYGLFAEYGWQAATRERFYGIGPSSKLDSESNYGFRGHFGSATGHWQVRSGLKAEVRAGWRRIDPDDGRLQRIAYHRDSLSALYEGQDLFGLFERIDLHDIGITLRHDWRDRPGSPLRGGTHHLAISRVFGNSRSDTTIGFWKVELDVTQYLNLYRGRAIGVRVLAEVTEPDDGTRVPFYELARLGGGSRLRGYKIGRFADRDLALFSAEYRWPLWRRLDAFLFTDQGRVFENLDKDFRFSRFQSSYGLGLRIWGGNSSVDLTLARGREATRFYLDLGATL